MALIAEAEHQAARLVRRVLQREGGMGFTSARLASLVRGADALHGERV